MTTLSLQKGLDLTTKDEATLERREFQRIYHQTWADVYRYAFVLLRHREDAEDVASEAYRRALESWDGARGRSSDAVAVDREHDRRRPVGERRERPGELEPAQRSSLERCSKDPAHIGG